MRPKPVQGELFSGDEHDIRLGRLNPHGNNPGLTKRQRETAEQSRGVSVKASAKHYGRILDEAYASADPGPQSHAVTLSGDVEIPKTVRPSAKATRERAARGVKPEGYDWYSRELVKHHNLSQETGYPRSRISAARAAVAQNIAEPTELPSVRHVAKQLSRGVAPEDVKGFGYHTNARMAARMLEGTDTAKDLPGHKPPGFEQSFEHPSEWGRPAMDRHMLRAGAPHLSSDEISHVQRSGGKTKSQGRVSPVHRILEEGLRTAASARGLTAQQAQPMVWFPAVRASTQKATARREAKRQEHLTSSQFKSVGSFKDADVGF